MQTTLSVQQADRAARANAPTASLAPRAAGWIESHPDAFNWLVERCDSNPFALSLLDSLRRWGRLTDNQLAAVLRNITRSKQSADRAQNAPTVSVAAIEDAFKRASDAGLKYPKLRLDTFTFSPAGAASRNPGAVYVKEDGQYLGKIMGGKLLSLFSVQPETEARIIAAASDPMNAAIAYGKRFGKCAVCARDLTDDDSVARGIGPVCAKKYGW